MEASMNTRTVLIPVVLVSALISPMAAVEAVAATAPPVSSSAGYNGWDRHPDYNHAAAQAQDVLHQLGDAHLALEHGDTTRAREALAQAAKHDAVLRGMMPAAGGSAQDRQMLPLRIRTTDEEVYQAKLSDQPKPEVKQIEQQAHIVKTRIVYMPVIDIGKQIDTARAALAGSQPSIKTANDAVERAMGSLVVSKTDVVHDSRP
jgi:hypothetical protein